MVDNCDETEYNYKYDGFDNVIEENHNTTYFYNTFDSNNRLTNVQIAAGDLDQNTEPVYEKSADGKIYPDNAVTGFNYNEGKMIAATRKDSYGRITSRKVLMNYNARRHALDEYVYYSVAEESGTRLTSLISSITQTYGEDGMQNLSYEYDNNGNITHVYKNGTLAVRYTYDAMNQLVREDNNDFANTYVYEYDTAGNILAQKIYPFSIEELGKLINTKTYAYETTGWKDRLIAVDDRAITYDELGNPTKYFGYDLTWDKVRQLKTFGYHTFYYGADGRRYRKDEKWYDYHGGKLLRERRPDGSIITFIYDTSGILGFNYRTNFAYDENGELSYDEKYYFYRKNLQGDVIAVYDEQGTKVAEYKYDAWGKCTIVKDVDGISEINPIRYRSYYYDTETALYYLNSRYYDPETGRFINADVVPDNGAGILGTNMFAYCVNNPVNMFDDNGLAPKYIIEQKDDTMIGNKKMKDISFGVGNIADNGCGVIAAYNVLSSYNSNVNFNKVKNDIILFGGLVFGGLGGTSALALANYMRSKYWMVHTAGAITNLWGIKAEMSDAVIIEVLWGDFSGAHYIAGISTGKSQTGGAFKFYNTGIKDKYNKSIDGREMSIWQFLKYLRAEGNIPLYLIGVNWEKGW